MLAKDESGKRGDVFSSVAQAREWGAYQSSYLPEHSRGWAWSKKQIDTRQLRFVGGRSVGINVVVLNIMV